jgi:hypothetical protein
MRLDLLHAEMMCRNRIEQTAVDLFVSRQKRVPPTSARRGLKR